ncbi:hypothetical protein IFM61606_10741 [Aspergillus udagawae]|nr:hypothetical protein IFM61606_10741 [Aspergillus udagawae]
MVSPYGTNYFPALVAENTNATGHLYWSTINTWLLLADGATSSETPQPSQTLTLANWWWGLSTPSASCWFPCVIVLPPVTLPPMQAPVITSLIEGVLKTITPPVAETPTLTVDPITISGTPSILNAPTSTSVTIQFNHSAIILPPFKYTDDDDGTTQNISGIIIPLPIKGPPPRSNSDDESSLGSSSSNCYPSISISNSSPWPKLDTPQPPGLDNNNNDEEGDVHEYHLNNLLDDDDDDDDNNNNNHNLKLVRFGTGRAWASSYPTITNDPVFGAGVPVALGGTYTPTSQYSIATNPGTLSSIAAIISPATSHPWPSVSHSLSISSITNVSKSIRQ